MLRSDFNAQDYISECALKSKEAIDLAGVCIAMIYHDHDGLSVDRYFNHVTKISNEVGRRFKELIKAGSEDDCGTRLAALKYVISDIHDYQVDSDHYEILEGADIIRVIDRGRGCSTAVSVLYMDAARKQGWNIEGLNLPARFLCRLEFQGERLIFDPSLSCRVMEAHNLRALVKQALGDGAELSTEYLRGLDVRETAVHLCNHIKHRRIEMGEYKRALSLIDKMMVLAPDEYRLLLDAGVLLVRTGNYSRARECLEAYIETAPSEFDKQDALMLLSDLPEG